jgi:hypothetical protein
MADQANLPGGPFVLILKTADPAGTYAHAIIGPFENYEQAKEAALDFHDPVITYLYDRHDWFAYQDAAK